jgi:hypothetical protein
VTFKNKLYAECLFIDTANSLDASLGGSLRMYEYSTVKAVRD